MAAKRINPEAYNALVDALASIYYNKRPFARFLQSHLRGQPDLIAGLSITGTEATKREVADEIVARLSDGEDRYQAVCLDLMVAVAEFSDFGNLRQQEDRERLVGNAKEAQTRLKVWVEAYSDLRAARERLATEIASRAEGEAKRRSWDAKHNELLARLMELYSLKDHQKRGILLEGLLNELFSLYDLSPRGAFRLAHEQIDGSFTHNTDDYILEAKWEEEPTGPKHLHILKGKVDARSKNVMGLFFAIEGFTPGAVDAYRHATALILMHGTDLYAVLDGKIDLRDLLERKRRHAAETGNPLLSVTEIIG